MSGADFPGDANPFPSGAFPDRFERIGVFERPASEPPVDLSPRRFTFTGSAGEYFRIWIVNLMLSIATLGIYSAWAKVRRLRYFYGHTSLDGAVFGYHASPIAILKGRLVAYGVVLVLGIVGQIAPFAVMLLYLPLIGLMPIILIRGLRFRARNSSYRGIRFGFDGQTADAVMVFLLLPLAVPFTLGFIYPFVVKRQREFVMANSRHGRSAFQLDLPAWPVYRIYVTAALLGVILFGVPVIMIIGAQLTEALANSSDEQAQFNPIVLVAMLLFYLAIGVLTVGIRTSFENLAWKHTTIDGHQFRSRLEIGRMFWYYVTNILAIAVTLGLAVPWARIRLARYRAESLTLLPAGPLVTEASGTGVEESATGAELTEAMDFDVGI